MAPTAARVLLANEVAAASDPARAVFQIFNRVAARVSPPKNANKH
jgi:hypothetical protein